MVSNDYVVGLTDGEGCFYIGIRYPKNSHKTVRVEPHFYIKLRGDDLSVLEEVKETFGCGAIYFQNEKRKNHSSCYRFEINALRDIKEKLAFVSYDFEEDMKKASQSRMEVYQLVEKIVGRPITPEEHEELRAIMVEYVKTQSEPYQIAAATWKEQNKELSRQLYSCMKKRGSPLEAIEKLIAALEQ